MLRGVSVPVGPRAVGHQVAPAGVGGDGGEARLGPGAGAVRAGTAPKPAGRGQAYRGGPKIALEKMFDGFSVCLMLCSEFRC